MKHEPSMPYFMQAEKKRKMGEIIKIREKSERKY